MNAPQAPRQMDRRQHLAQSSKKTASMLSEFQAAAVAAIQNPDPLTLDNLANLANDLQGRLQTIQERAQQYAEQLLDIADG